MFRLYGLWCHCLATALSSHRRRTIPTIRQEAARTAGRRDRFIAGSGQGSGRVAQQAVHCVLDVGRIDADRIKGQGDTGISAKMSNPQSDRSRDFAKAGQQDHISRCRHPFRRYAEKRPGQNEMENARCGVKRAQGYPASLSPYVKSPHRARMLYSKSWR